MTRLPIPTLVLLAAPIAAGAAIDHPHRPGELIVRFAEGTSEADRQATHRALGAELLQRLGGGKWELVRVDPDADLEQRHAAYEARAEVQYAHPNFLGEGGFVPNDTFFGNQWQHRNTGQFGGSPGADIESVAGWDLENGSTGIVVAVLDTGSDSDHAEVAGRIVAGFDFVPTDADPEDAHFHGSAVTGRLAANANTAFQVAGVDHLCRIMPVKVLDANNNGAVSWLVDGIVFAYTNGAKVLSMSLINYPASAAIRDALGDSRAAGSINVACAGNGGIGNANVSWPGASNRSISIGATNNVDWRASYSGTGDALDFVAPGDDVVTIEPHTAMNTWWFFNGCSSATPVAAGIVSILVAVEPSLLQNQVIDLLIAGAEDQVGNPAEDTPGYDEFMGWGRLNLKASLDALLAATAVTEDVLARGFDVEIFPNPAVGRSAIAYTLPAPSRVAINIHDVAGRRVRALVEGVRPEGRHEVRWDGRDDAGTQVSAGVYFARIEAGGRADVRKIALVR
ncbi:MAG: S8 family peptidase [bacterium]